MQYTDSYNESILSFANNINTHQGGTHLTGFRNAITRVLNDYARTNKILKDSEQNLSGDDVREGLTAIVSVKIENPEFEGQTKEKLGNSEVMPAVQDVVKEKLQEWLEFNPKLAKLIIEKHFKLRERVKLHVRQENLQEENLFLRTLHFRVSSPTVLTESRKNAKFTSLRVILPAVLQNKAETECFRQFCL